MPIIKDIKKIKKKISSISSRFDSSKRKKELKIVEKIIEDVRKKGDKALFYYTKKFDKVNLTSLSVPKSQINNSTKQISEKLLSSIKYAISRIGKFQIIGKLVR